MSKYSDIIDNRTLKLRDEIITKLDASEQVKFAVGYLYLSGFNQVADKLEQLKEAKILIGSNLNKSLIEALAETLPSQDDVEEEYKKNTLQKKEEKKNVINQITSSITQNVQSLPHTFNRQKEISKLVELVDSGKLTIKVYTKYPLHAKAYIFKYQQQIAKASSSEGICIVGSSNLTMSGFNHNTELNSYVHGQKNYEELNKWFNQLWDESVPFDESMKKVLEDSWAIKTVNPYDIFILTLYHLTKSTIEKQTAQIWFWENPDYMERLISRFSNMEDLYPFQKVAIMQAYEWVQKYKGVFISDVVGLGKTYIGAGLLRQLNRRTLIISPPHLMDMWEEFIEKFEINARVLSRGMLYNGTYNNQSALWPYREREVVLIDESHHFRNDDTNMYKELQPFLANKLVVLMTATPQNTSAWNIYNQIKLFNQTEENIFPNRYEEPHLRNLFKKVDDGEYNLPDLLKYIVIRRTRRHIKRFYSNGEFEITFPKRNLETVTYNINDTYNYLYETIRSMLTQLTYARYDLWSYVKADKKHIEPYFQLQKVIGTLTTFHRINLFKRLESSIYAFRRSVDNMVTIHEKFLTIIEKKNIIPAGEEIQDRIYRYNLDDIWDKIDDLVGEYRTEDFEITELTKDLKHDIEIFRKIQNELKAIPINKDAKYDTLLEIIEELRSAKNQNKVLVFSEYADTVKYLYDRLKNSYGNIDLIHGGTTGNAEKIKAFAPKANNYNGDRVLDILVATDVLSEGHNLQDCSAVINYDLHWNPVRLIQRAGRVDRIGSEAEEICIKNFIPTEEVKEEINITNILERRVQEIHDHIGEDEKILSQEERLNENAMYAIYKTKDMETLEEGEERDFTPEEAEIIIKNLLKEKPEYMALIKKMQLGLRSGKSVNRHKGTYAFFKRGDYGSLLIRHPDGSVLDDFIEVLNEIRCDPNEPEKNISKEQLTKYYEDIEYLRTYFSKKMSSENIQARIHPEVRKSEQRLREMAEQKRDNAEYIEGATKISKILNSFFPNNLIAQLKVINKENDDDRFYEELVNLYNQNKLSEIIEGDAKKEKVYTEFICGELLL